MRNRRQAGLLGHGKIASVLGALGLLAAWWLVARIFFGSRGAIPDPVLVIEEIAGHLEFFTVNAGATASSAAQGFLWGNLVAVVLALVCALAPSATRLVMPPSVVLYSMPLIAIAPILVVLFGGNTPSVVLAALSVFFPTLINSLDGLQQVDAAALDVVTACGGRRLAPVRKVRAWSCLPRLAAGLKIAAPSAFLGAILGEFLGSDRGLGVALVVAQQNGDSVKTWAIAVVCTALAGASYAAVSLAERLLLPWAASGTAGAWSATPVATETLARSLQGRAGRRLARRGAVLSASAVAWATAAALVWWALVGLLGLDRFTAKTPPDVWTYLFNEPGSAAARGAIIDALGVTIRDALVGFAAGSVAAILLAAGVIMWRTAESAIMPVALVLRSVPLAAMAPVVTLVLGHGLVAKATVAAVVVFFPSFVSALLGFRSVAPATVELFLATGARPGTIFAKARVPNAVPDVLSSLRIGLPGSLIGILIAEWLVTGDGIGAFMIDAQNRLNYNGLWSAALVVTLAAVFMYFIAAFGEQVYLQRMRSGSSRTEKETRVV